VRPDVTLPRIPRVGPSSTRVLLELLATGRSATVDRAVEASGRAADVERRRSLRIGFRSRAEVRRVLRTPLPGVVERSKYLGDLQMHSRWSDGAATIAELAAGGRALGYSYLAITDHCRG
jgi:hypothetical protein